MVRICVAIFLPLALLGFTAFAYAERAGRAIKGDPSWALVILKDAKAPPAIAAKAKALLSEHPLDQAALNLLFAIETRGDLDNRRRQAFVSTLGALGWRDTPSQQNLMLELLKPEDPSKAVLRADALLRRGRLVGNIVPLLTAMESYPDAAELLIERLAEHPNWRADYFAYSAPQQTAAGLAARVRLLERMLVGGEKLSHAELAPSLNMMMRANRPDDVVRIGLRAIKANVGDALIYDPDFAKAAVLSPVERANPLPFEWEMVNQTGISTSIIAHSDSKMRLRWNGYGAPVIARIMTLMREPRPLNLAVEADSVDALDHLEMFVFSLKCPSVRPIAFVPINVDQTRKLARFSSESAPPCGYPDLVISGRPQTNDRSVETTISSVRLTSVN